MILKDISKTKRQINRILMYGILVILTVTSVYPFIIILINSTRSHADIMSSTISIMFGGHFFDNYAHLVKAKVDLWRGLYNSTLITTSSTFLNVYFGTMAGYAFVVYRFPFKNTLFISTIGLLMIPPQLGLLGLYDMVSRFDLIDTYYALILPSMGSIGTCFFMRQYILANLSMELIEQGRVEGASELKIFHKIICPILKPAIATMTIFGFIGSWNNLLNPLILLDTPEKFPLVSMLAQLPSGMLADYGMVYFALNFAVIPILIIFVICAKHIISGISEGGIKS